MNLVINSQFRPFTYDEMVKPLVAYKEAYDKVEQDYSDLVTQTEMWKDIATKENSPEAYAMYQRYSSDLNAIVDDFSRGMNINNRRALIGMKRRYAQDITPIAQADAAMKEANEFRAKAGPDAIFEVSQYDSLDQFLHGKKANNRYQSREALTKKAAAMSEAAMAEAMKDPEFKKVMGDQYWQITQHSGGSYADLVEAMKLGMMDNPLAQNRFSQIRQEVARKAGIQNYDAFGQQAIMDAIDLGLYAGLDKPVTQFQTNQGYLNPLQQEQLRQMKMAGSSSGGGRHGGGSSSSSSSSSKSSSKSKKGGDDDDGGNEESEFMVQDIILEQGKNGLWGASTKYDYGSNPGKAHGYAYEGDLEKLPKKEREAIEAEVGNISRNLYQVRRWRDSETGRGMVQIVGKKAAPKPAPKNSSAKVDVVSKKYGK